VPTAEATALARLLAPRVEAVRMRKVPVAATTAHVRLLAPEAEATRKLKAPASGGGHGARTALRQRRCAGARCPRRRPRRKRSS